MTGVFGQRFSAPSLPPINEPSRLQEPAKKLLIDNQDLANGRQGERSKTERLDIGP